MTDDPKKANADALAIRWSLESSYRGLRDEARRIVEVALEEEDGVLRRAAAKLGVDHKTLESWVHRFPALHKIRLRAAKRREGGRLPKELEDDES